MAEFDGIVRPLIREDLAPLKPILETWVRDPKSGEILSREVMDDLLSMSDSLNGRNSMEYLVAQNLSGRVIGMMGLSDPKDVLIQFATTSNPLELVNAYIDKNHRAGQGVGTALVNRLIEKAIEKGSIELLLDSGPRYKETGWGFWDKQPGFRRVGIAEGLYGPGNDAPVWQKLLI